MAANARLSTAISRETRELLERYAKRTGVKKGRLIEEALRSYLIAHEGLPSDLLAPSTVQLTAGSRRKFARGVPMKVPHGGDATALLPGFDPQADAVVERLWSASGSQTTRTKRITEPPDVFADPSSARWLSKVWPSLFGQSAERLASG